MSVLAASFKLFEGDCAILLLLKLFNFQFGVFQPAFAHLEQLGSFLEFREEFGQRHLTGLHRFDDELELAEGVFERKFGVGKIHSRPTCGRLDPFQIIFEAAETAKAC
jgi:hypothetical protein